MTDVFNISLSRYLAIFLGLITPILETVRRWHTWQEDPLSFFDDYILGGLLLYGVWRVTRDQRSGQKFLVLAWGFALGLVYASIDHQLQVIRAGGTDPAPISSEVVAVVKSIGLAIVVVGLLTSLRKTSIEG